MAMQPKTLRRNLSSRQQELLVTELENRPQLISARIADYRQYTKQQLKESWEVVAEIVSGEKGIRVCGDELKARWLKWKCRIKSKAAFLKKNVNEAKEEGQVESTYTLTRLEEKVLKLLVKVNSYNVMNNEEQKEEIITSEPLASTSNVIIGTVYQMVGEDIQTASPQLSLGSVVSVAESSVSSNARESPIFFESAVMAPVHEGSAPQAVKRKHRELTLSEKIELLKKLNSDVSVKELCEIDSTGISTVYAMTVQPKTMRRNLSSRQQELLVTELEKRPELLSARSAENRQYTKQQLKESWEIVAQIVSSLPGMKVCGDELKARWCKWKCRIKSKATALSKNVNEEREDGQVEGTVTLTRLEDKVLKLLVKVNSSNLVKSEEQNEEITSEPLASSSNVIIGALYQMVEEDIRTASPQLSLGSVSIAESPVSSNASQSPIIFESAERAILPELVADESSGPYSQNGRQESSSVERMFHEIIQQQLEVGTTLASLRDAVRDQTEVFRETNSILREIVSAIRK